MASTRPPKLWPRPTSPPKPSCGGAETLTRRRGSEPVLASTERAAPRIHTPRKPSLQTGHVALQAAYAPKHNARRASAPSLGELHASAAYKSGAATSRRGSNPVLAAHGYEELSPIASGAFSMVVRALRTETAQEVAIKTFQRVKIEAKDKAAAANMRNELHVLKRLQPSAHPAIANVIEVLEAEKTTHVALEYCAGGSLRRQLQKSSCKGLAERVAATVIGQVASALRHLHAAGACHRDVKPENVLYVDGACTRVKLCDFGFAVICSSDRRLKTVCGTPQYMAPEIWRADPGGTYAGPPVDMWSLGALAYEALHGHAAFRGSSMEQLKMRVLRADHERLGKELSERARALLAALLVPDPAARATAAETLDHPFIPANIGTDPPELPALGSSRQSSHRSAAAPEAPAPAPPPASPPPAIDVSVSETESPGSATARALAKLWPWPTAPPSPAEYSI